MGTKKALALLCIIMLIASISTACGRPNTGDESENTGQAAKSGINGITVNGSTSVQPLAEELAKAFKEKNPDAIIDIQGGGSGVGIKSAMDGVVDIGMSSRELKAEEKSLREFKIAVDGITVIVNPDNKISNLTTEQIFKIYTGEIKNWSELGGRTGRITVVSREEGSGTRGAFIELTGIEVKENDEKVDKTIAAAITQASTGAVLTTVASDPNAIGYASYGPAKERSDIKMVNVDGKACTEENIYAGVYKIARPFLLLTKMEAEGISKEFIDFILSPEGQETVAKHGFLKASK